MGKPIATNELLPPLISTPSHSVIKLWDLRIPNNRKTIPEPAFQSLDRTCETSKRSRGIICLTESPKNGMLYALSGDNR